VGSCDLHFKTLLSCAHNSTSTIADIRQYLLVALSLAAVLSCPLRELLVQLEGDAAHAHHLRRGRGGALSEQKRSRRTLGSVQPQSVCYSPLY
jgi:hypothetical protein